MTRMRINACFGLFLLMWLTFFPFCPVHADEPRVVRVGYPIQEGLTDKEEDGDYTGYIYEYLEEIAQYTGWEYEFVEAPGDLNESLGRLLEMLEDGRVDMMGTMVYTESLAQIYEYPGSSCGTAHTALKVLQENLALNQYNYTTYPNLRIALSQGAEIRKAELDAFTDSMGVRYTPVYCVDEEGLLAALRDGRADAMLDRDINRVQGLRTICKFAPQPFYFALTKGKTALAAELNGALTKINETDPSFTVNLHEKYFGDGQTADFLLSEDEKSWLEKAEPLRVGIDLGDAPIQSADGEEYWGITLDILEVISQKTGLRFEIVPFNSREALYGQLETGGVDLGAGIPENDYLTKSSKVVLTRPYLLTQVVMVVGNRAEGRKLDGKRLALARGLRFDGPFMGSVQWYDTPEDTMRALRDGEADYTYGNNYMVEYYSKQFYMQNRVSMVPQSGLEQRLCIGLSRPYDARLLTVLNKAILSIPYPEVQQISLQNSTRFRKATIRDLFYSNPSQSLLLVGAAAALLMGLLLLYTRTKTAAARRERVANERYRRLSELSGEFLFEYDYRRDELALSEESAGYFGCGRLVKNYVRDLADGEQEKEKWRGLVKEEAGVFEVLCPSPVRESRWFRGVYQKISDGSGKPLYLMGKLTDIHEERREKERLQSAAAKDGLTGILNAAASRQEITQRCGPGGALILMDVDRFKEINDRCGHYTGDVVLKNVAGALTKVFGDEAVIGRWGGDEFAVYLSQAGGGEALEGFCRRIQEAMEGVCLEGKDFPVSVSIGAALCAGEDYETLYKAADDALYQSKRTRRGSYHIALPD